MANCKLRLIEHIDNSNMFSLIVDRKTIYKAYKLTTRGGLKLKQESKIFVCGLYKNIEFLRTSILDGTYQPGKYTKAIIADTKRREIWIPEFRDKVVQHMINIIIREYYERKYIFDSYACIRGKGNHKAVRRLQTMLRKSNREYGKNNTLLKLDISKFFYTIDKETFINVLKEDITCEHTINLITKLVYSFEPDKVGLPLGNLTSQQFANILLHKFDKYVKNTKQIKYYVRYADDMFFLLPNKQRANQLQKEFINYLATTLKLTCNPIKCYIQEMKQKQNICGLGFNIYIDKILLLSHIKRRFKKYIKRKDIVALNSVFAHMSIANCYGFINKCIYGSKIKFILGKFYLN